MAANEKKYQPAKTAAIAAAKAKFEDFSDYIFTNYRGLTVAQITDLRDQLRAKNCEFRVVRNNFARVACEELKIENVSAYFEGPTAVALVKQDSNEAAKVLFDFAKDTPALEIKGGYIGNAIYDAKQMEAYSKLPGKTQLITMFACALNATTQKFAATLQAVVDKKNAEGSN